LKRTTEALVMSEAHSLELAARVKWLESELALLDPQQPASAPPDTNKPVCEHWYSPEPGPCDWDVCRQKGGDDGQGEADDSASVGEAVPAHPFSD
jgi:hypothetical protein